MPRTSNKPASIRHPSHRLQSPPAPTVSIASPSLGETLKHSIAMGVGSSIGHRIVGGILGAPTVAVQQSIPATCSELPALRESLKACLRDGGVCSTELNAIERCLKGGG